VKLQTRLAVLFGVLALAVSAVVGGSSYRATSGQILASTDDFLSERADALVQGSRQFPEGRRSSQRGTVTLAFDPDAIVQVTSRTGAILGSSGAELPITSGAQEMIDLRPGDVRRSRNSFDDVEVDGEPFRMVTKALSDGGAIQVARSTAEDDGLLRSLLLRFGIIALITTAGASVLGWWVARQTTRPLRRLADVAATVADTRDFDVEVPIDRSDEIGTLAASMRTMLAALSTSRDQQQRLVQDASHELRTPLTSLRANVAMLDRIEQSAGTMSAGDRAAIVGAISAETAELGSLFDELIDLASDSDDRNAELLLVRLDEIVARAATRWQQRTARRLDLEAMPITVLGDAAMLERAVTNLIGNAHKFSPADEPIEIVVGECFVSVRDRGPGIAAADRTRIFDRFYRSEATRTMPGSGLGLAIVAKIVEHHGGEVWARESERGGADVGFRLPEIID